MSAATSEVRARELLERGFTVFDRLLSDEEVRALRAPIAARYRSLGAPETFARPPKEPAADVEISIVGLIFHRLGRHFPELAPRLFHPDVIEASRAVLGAEMHFEYAAAVVNHGPRPFFPWHAHMGGVDNAVYRKQGIFPRYDASERVTGLIYLDDLTPENGTLLVRPRRIDDPTEPPGEPADEGWRDAVELQCTRGTVVLLEQCTWHAARPKRSEGLRAFIAFYLTSSRAEPTTWIDDSWAAHAGDSELLASILPRPRTGS